MEQPASDTRLTPATGQHAAISHNKTPIHILALGALGVVFGDRFSSLVLGIVRSASFQTNRKAS
jgi:hypothetical protein